MESFAIILLSIFFNQENIFKKIIFNKKNIITLFFSGILIFLNWAIWIFAISNNQIIDASFGYFIMPIISVLLGYIFFKEKLNINF